jgi:DNA-binding FadR family transcriptional regulator
MIQKIRWADRSSSSAPGMNLHLQIARHIGSLIAQGTLKPESVLPTESLLGDQFGVSRTVLREAIKVLASKGLVEVRRKTGTRVRPRTHWNMLDPEILTWSFSGAGMHAGLTDLLEVRKIIEPAAARIAAQRATSENLAEIRSAYLGMAAALEDLPSSIESDVRFHLAVLMATHNAFMRPFGALIETALRASFRLTSSNNKLYRRILPLHRAVADAIEAGDGDAAETAMQAVLAQTSRDVVTQVKAGAGKKGRSAS